MLKNNSWLVGLKFTHQNGYVDEIKGDNSNAEQEGPISSVDIDLKDGEDIVGVTVEYAEVPIRIGFTIMRTR